MPKKRKKPLSKEMIILLVVIAIIVLVVIAFKISKQITKENTDLTQQTSSNIYEEVKSDNVIFSITNRCSWSGTYLKCAGEVKDTETKPHTTGDIYIDLIAFDNEKKCGYCNSRINLGKFSESKIKTYSLICDIGKKVDILAKITVSARASQIFNGC